jgi:hypothetical protein
MYSLWLGYTEIRISLLVGIIECLTADHALDAYRLLSEMVSNIDSNFGILVRREVNLLVAQCSKCKR